MIAEEALTMVLEADAEFDKITLHVDACSITYPSCSGFNTLHISSGGSYKPLGAVFHEAIEQLWPAIKAIAREKLDSRVKDAKTNAVAAAKLYIEHVNQLKVP